MPCGGASRELQAKDIKDNKDTIPAREIWADNLRLRDKKTSCGYPNQFTLIFRTSDAICNECKTSAQESSMIAPSNLTQGGLDLQQAFWVDSDDYLGGGAFVYASGPRNLILGPKLEVRFPWRVSVEVGALHRDPQSGV